MRCTSLVGVHAAAHDEHVVGVVLPRPTSPKIESTTVPKVAAR
jgi:hypothetical protein